MSRLATAVKVQFSAFRIASQFFRAMFAVPKIPHRQIAWLMFTSAGCFASLSSQDTFPKTSLPVGQGPDDEQGRAEKLICHRQRDVGRIGNPSFRYPIFCGLQTSPFLYYAAPPRLFDLSLAATTMDT